MTNLENKTLEFKEKLKAQTDEEMTREIEEYGLIRIREILAGFQNTGMEKRCDCLLPCSRKFYNLQSWRSDAKNQHEIDTGSSNGYAFFQVALMLSFCLSCLSFFM